MPDFSLFPCNFPQTSVLLDQAACPTPDQALSEIDGTAAVISPLPEGAEPTAYSEAAGHPIQETLAHQHRITHEMVQSPFRQMVAAG